MKHIILFTTIFLTIVYGCQQEQATTQHREHIIKVGVLDRSGSPFCVTDVIESVKIDGDLSVRTVSAADIVAGKTKDIAVYILPGGSGLTELTYLGDKGRAALINDIVKNGKAIIGICAGAYGLVEATSNYPSLSLSGAGAIDVEHDNRGHGLVSFSLTPEGKTIFPELANRQINFMQYYEGPVLIPAQDSKYSYSSLATMLSDVHTVEGAPANMTVNRPFIIETKVGKGKSVSVVGHPEATPGMRWIVPRLVRYLTDGKIKHYPAIVVRPEIYSHEILYTDSVLAIQDKAYQDLLGSESEKIQAMQKLVDICAWSAKKKLPAFVRDSNFNVQLKAAELTVWLERTDAIPDLKAAVNTEKNPQQKAQLQEFLDKLERIIGK